MKISWPMVRPAVFEEIRPKATTACRRSASLGRGDFSHAQNPDGFCFYDTGAPRDHLAFGDQEKLSL
jgi:hypothetical protein